MIAAVQTEAEVAASRFPILTALVLVPAVGAFVVAAMSKRRPEWVKLTAILFSVFVGAISVWMFASFKTASSDFQFTSQHEWIKTWGISWHLGVDGIDRKSVV